MFLKKALPFFLLLFSIYQGAFGQCNALLPSRNVVFKTDQSCAPVTVTEFTISYFFTIPQAPGTISIVYEWNDPGNNTTVVSGGDLVSSDGDRVFTADASFTYNTNDGQCGIRPTAILHINNIPCPTSRQVQTAFFWAPDDQANGEVTIAPQNWDVCYQNPIVNAQFRDASIFNCNVVDEPDNPNRMQRHMQFVYGTNHNPAATVRDLTLTDGGAQPLTDGAGNLVSPTTRGLGAPVTAAYFGPIESIPFPADAPTATSFFMNAPMNLANAVGNRFEVTLYNWNICNPWNNDPLNPNYEDAIATRAYITIVDPPAPSFFARDVNNVAKTDFCINEEIFFRNTTPNINNNSYTWRFYDDAAGTVFLGQRTNFNPTFSFATGGQKMVRLIATSNTAQGACVQETTRIFNITPALAANIRVTDLSNNPITGDFCQKTTAPLDNFEVRFTDASLGTITPSTRWRWRFYDQSNNLVFESPGGGAYSNVALGPFDRTFTTPGLYNVVLSIRDNLTPCESVDTATIRVFERPIPSFSANRVCIGNPTHFVESSTVDAIAGEQIVLREWDLNYDGSFDKDASLDNQTEFDFQYAAAGNYDVMLQVTTNTGACSQQLIRNVIVDPLPNANISTTVTSGCSVLEVDFTNNAIAGQPDLIDEYQWEVDDRSGNGFQVESIQQPSDPDFSAIHTIAFENVTSGNLTFDVRLRVITVNGCEQISNVIAITVNPGPTSGFVSLNYSPFDDNCSPVSVDFIVDSETQALNPTDYEWTVSDANGVISQQSTGTTPSYTFIFANSTQIIKNYEITLNTVLPSGCSEDSTRIIQVSPVPSSAFVANILDNNCQEMSFKFEATQKGLVEYVWTILINNIVITSKTSTDDFIDFDVNKIAVDQTLQVRLVTRNATNCQSNQGSQNIIVPRSSNLVAAFTATPAIQQLPNSLVSITNTSTPGPWQYTWDFGDNTTSTNPNIPNHTYTAAGTYMITLTISDNTCSSTHSASVQINPIPPVVDFSYNPPRGCAPLTVDFTNLSQFADPSTYVWQFGANQGTSNAVNPSYTYFDPGIYTVSLSAANATGDVDTETKSMIIEVLASPLAQFSVYPLVLDIPGDILYTRNRSVGAASYHWDFGDAGTSIEFEPQHKYETEGTYEIQLIAYGTDGCNDTTILSSPVRAEMSGRVLIPNAFTPSLIGPGSSNKGNNEMFIPLMNRVAKFQMYVFNRWGTLMFESTDQDIGWDGYFEGKLCPQDVYIYKIVLEYDNGKSITKTGDVNLIR